MGLRGDTAALFDLNDRAAIVTGGTRGIGRAIALALAEAGARVLVSSEDPQACDAVAGELAARGLDVQGLSCDLSRPGGVVAFVEQAATRLGRLDILVSNAGIPGPVGALAAATPAEIDAVLDINLRSAMALSGAAIPHIVRQGGGSVLFIASIAGLRGNKAIGLYGISKAAVAQLARNLAVEWGPQGVRANAISPGLIASEFSRGMMANDALMERRLSLTPLRRVGRAEEIAAAALFLVAPGGAFVTGQNLVIDGGTLVSDGN
ncbi:MAG: hypothetical protein RL684_1332 [Pseudomonadota bacterium]|jgi:NAD(P)-dependent dehydrogenase (short-subunit alcohol dehydrogenase family)